MFMNIFLKGYKTLGIFSFARTIKLVNFQKIFFKNLTKSRNYLFSNIFYFNYFSRPIKLEDFSECFFKNYQLHGFFEVYPNRQFFYKYFLKIFKLPEFFVFENVFDFLQLKSSSLTLTTSKSIVFLTIGFNSKITNIGMQEKILKCRQHI